MYIDFESKWKEFCCDLVDDSKHDVKEDIYQLHVENGFRQLGWSKSTGELCPKERINVGSHSQLEPDITMKIDGKVVFVVEIKRPGNRIIERQEQQLLSYMRVMKTNIGLFIGYDIRLYYDTNEKIPCLVWKSEVNPMSAFGMTFIEFFQRESFCLQKIESLCKQKYSEINSRTIMTNFSKELQNDQDNTIRNTLYEYFVNFKQCNKDIVNEFLTNIVFTSYPRTNFQQSNILSTTSKGQVIMVDQKKTGKRDMTKYSLDGGLNYFGKGKFVKIIVEMFMKNNPTLTYSQLKQVFPDELQGSYGVLRTIGDLEASTQDRKDLSTRYEVKTPIHSYDGVEFVVCNQWGKYNFLNILKLLEKWEWNIVTQ